jgi:hypothetical protein
MKVEERKKKFIVGISLYTMGIILLVVNIDVAMMYGPWWMILIGLGAYYPLTIIGSNLMLLSRWRWW